MKKRFNEKKALKKLLKLCKTGDIDYEKFVSLVPRGCEYFSRLIFVVILIKREILGDMLITDPEYDVVAESVVNADPLALSLVDINAKDYFKIAACAIEQDPKNLILVPVVAPCYLELALLAIRIDPKVLTIVFKDVEQYETICEEAIKNDPLVIKYISSKTANYSSLALKSIEDDFNAFDLVDKTAPVYLQCVKKIMEVYPDRRIDIIKKVKNGPCSDKLLSFMVNKDYRCIYHVSKSSPRFLEMLLSAVKQNPDVINEYNEEGIKGFEIVLTEVAKNNALVLKNYSEDVVNKIMANGKLFSEVLFAVKKRAGNESNEEFDYFKKLRCDYCDKRELMKKNLKKSTGSAND